MEEATRDSKFWLKFARNYTASQISVMIGLTSTNIFEVIKVRKMVDSYHCEPSHYQSKSRLSRFLNNAKLFWSGTNGQTTQKNNWPSVFLNNAKQNLYKEAMLASNKQPVFCGAYGNSFSHDSRYYKANKSQEVFNKLKNTVGRRMVYTQPVPQACQQCLPRGNVLEISRKLIEREGVQKIFFGGLKSAILSSMIRVGIFFPTREFFTDYFRENFKQNHFVNDNFNRSIISTFFARTLSTLISFPLEVRKIDSQNNSKFGQSKELGIRKIISDTKMFSVFMQYYQKEMLTSLLFWVTFEKTKENLTKWFNSRKNTFPTPSHNPQGPFENTKFDQNSRTWKRQFNSPSSPHVSEFWLNVMCAMVSGFVSSMATHPNDYLTTITNVLKNQNLKKNGALSVLRDLQHRNGISSVLAGLWMRASKNMFLNGIFFFCYQSLKDDSQSFK